MSGPGPIPDIGTFRHRIAIEATADVPDGAGGYTRSWQPVCTCWAAAEAMPAPEAGADETLRPDGVIRFVIRWHEGVDTAMRIVHAGRPLDIESVVDPDQRRRHLVILARETDA